MTASPRHAGASGLPHPVLLQSQLLVIAKQPAAGKVKTRLCPPCTPEQAARVATAALTDTLDAVRATPCRRRVAVVTGRLAPAGFDVLRQRGDGLGERLVNAFADSGSGPSLLIGMDTPQLTAGLLRRALTALADVDAVLGLAEDGGWWGLGLQDTRHARVLSDVPMSTDQTGSLTLQALRRSGCKEIRLLPILSDVDTFALAQSVAALSPLGSFAGTVATVAAEIGVEAVRSA